MNISKNLLYLRKKHKITQEELADRLGVSRQSVSKWETGEAYPETEKLLVICDEFGVSLDALMRGDFGGEQPGEELPQSAFSDNAGFAEHTDRFSRGIAAGVFLVIFGVALSMIPVAFSEILTGKTADLMGIFTGVTVIAFVAAAVFLFVLFGMEHDRYIKEHPSVADVFDEVQIRAFRRRFSVVMACLVSGILVDVVYLVVFASLIDAQVIKAANEGAAYCFVVAVFLAALAFIVGGLVYFGIQSNKYNVAEYNKQTGDELNPTPRKKLSDAICGAVMLSATAIFLVIGFVWDLWHPGWIVFPVGGIICGIISGIFHAKDN